MSEARGEYWILWQFDVKAGQESRFEGEYGPEGGWVQLFSGAAGYLGSDLSPPAHIARRYLTIDRWIARGDYERWLDSHYAAARAHVDALIDPLKTRDVIAFALDLCLAHGGAGHREHLALETIR